jgi:hypothetical protein
MAQPFNATTTTMFSNDQNINFSVTSWDTTLTVPQQGMTFSLFDKLTTTHDLTSLTTPAAISTALQDRALYKSILGYSGSAYRTGVLPNLYMYWGPGAPTGGSTARKAALRFSGTVTGVGATPTAVTLVFGGYGGLTVFKNGTLVRSGSLKEPVAKPVLTSLALTESQGGYLIVPVTVQDGDTLDIVYQQNGQAWGGIVAKVIPTGVSSFNDGTGVWSFSLFRSYLRDAAVLGSSFLSSGA